MRQKYHKQTKKIVTRIHDTDNNALHERNFNKNSNNAKNYTDNFHHYYCSNNVNETTSIIVFLLLNFLLNRLINMLYLSSSTNIIRQIIYHFYCNIIFFFVIFTPFLFGLKQGWIYWGLKYLTGLQIFKLSGAKGLLKSPKKWLVVEKVFKNVFGVTKVPSTAQIIPKNVQRENALGVPKNKIVEGWLQKSPKT